MAAVTTQSRVERGKPGQFAAPGAQRAQPWVIDSTFTKQKNLPGAIYTKIPGQSRASVGDPTQGSGAYLGMLLYPGLRGPWERVVSGSQQPGRLEESFRNFAVGQLVTTGVMYAFALNAGTVGAQARFLYTTGEVYFDNESAPGSIIPGAFLAFADAEPQKICILSMV